MHHKMLISTTLFTFCTIAVAEPTQVKQQEIKQAQRRAAAIVASRAEYHSYLIWMNSPLMEDDTPYAALRTRIESQIAQGQKAGLLMRRYKIVAVQKPRDPKALFAWGFAAWKALDSKADSVYYKEAKQSLSDVYVDLEKIPVPHTYNIVRLRYLIQQDIAGGDNIKMAGENLLRFHPDDYEVLYYQTTILSRSKDPTEGQQALATARKLATQYPEKRSVYQLLGEVYFQSWLRTHDKADKAQAQAGFQQYLQRVSPHNKPDAFTAMRLAQLQNGTE